MNFSRDDSVGRSLDSGGSLHGDRRDELQADREGVSWPGYHEGGGWQRGCYGLQRGAAAAGLVVFVWLLSSESRNRFRSSKSVPQKIELMMDQFSYLRLINIAINN